MRSFTIHKVMLGKSNKTKFSGKGRYISNEPSSAVSKAFTQICRVLKFTSATSLKIAIRETTQGSDKKIFYYKVSKIHDPLKVKRDNVEVTYKYVTNVESISEF